MWIYPPVFAQQRHDFTAPQTEIDVIQRFDAGEKLAKPFRAKDFLVTSAFIFSLT
jgi:hypothetical protein